MSDRSIILWAIAAFAWAAPVAAQAPASTTTAFDGTYVGVLRTATGTEATNGSMYICARGDGQPPAGRITIAGGVARYTWAGGTVDGSVNAQGVLVIRNPNGIQFNAQIDGRGTIRGRVTGNCSYDVVWQKEGK
jgi:hypothetical protein